MHPLLNIHFCGSGIEGSRAHFASLKALSTVQNKLIISGVGAPPGFCPHTQENYPAPGTFKINEYQQILKKSHRWSLLIARSAGWIFGYGEKENLRWALAKIAQQIALIPAFSEKKRVINLSGYSRGGTSAIYLAHLIKQLYGNQIELNLFLIDPNAGPGQHHVPYKRIIPDNVKRLYITSNRDEIILFFKSRSFSYFKMENSQLHYATLLIAGSHLAQEKFPQHNPLLSPALTNQYLLSMFYTSFALNDWNDTEIYLHSDNIRIQQYQFTRPKSLLDQLIKQLS